MVTQKRKGVGCLHFLKPGAGKEKRRPSLPSYVEKEKKGVEGKKNIGRHFTISILSGMGRKLPICVEKRKNHRGGTFLLRVGAKKKGGVVPCADPVNERRNQNGGGRGYPFNQFPEVSGGRDEPDRRRGRPTKKKGGASAQKTKSTMRNLRVWGEEVVEGQ